ncbi:MAG TPA: peptidyl-prolyl cis-trans isomerase [Solirubrobacterales bacterium]
MSPQARKGNPAKGARTNRPAPKTSGTPKPRKRLMALIFGVALVVIAAVVIIGRGHVDEGSAPSEGIAEVQDVDDGTITQEDFDASITRTAEGQGLKKPPPPDDPNYTALRDQALGEVLLPLWIEGEAADRGISVTDEEVSQRAESIVKENFGDQKEFDKFVEEQGFCTEDELASGDPTVECEGVQREVRVMLLAEAVQEAVIPADLTAVTSGEASPEEAESAIPQEDVEEFYDENIEQFQVPETRDVRVIQNQDEAKVSDAISELDSDDSEKNWEAVAKEFSQDPVSKDRGGLLEGVVEGQSPGGPAFDEAVFGAAEGEIVGPIETDNGFYAAQVVKVNPEETTPVDDVSDQIRQQLAGQEQERLATEFEEDFVSKWTELTVCAESVLNDRCANFEPPNPRSCDGQEPLPEGCPPGAPDPLACTDQTPPEAGCAAPVVSRKPRKPGTPADSDPLTNLAQGPFSLPQPAATGLPGGIPGGALPPGVAPGGAVPPGAVPPGAAPPGAAPPGAVPPGAAPPGGAAVPPGAGGAPVPTAPPAGGAGGAVPVAPPGG